MTKTYKNEDINQLVQSAKKTQNEGLLAIKSFLSAISPTPPVSATLLGGHAVHNADRRTALAESTHAEERQTGKTINIYFTTLMDIANKLNSLFIKEWCAQKNKANLGYAPNPKSLKKSEELSDAKTEVDAMLANLQEALFNSQTPSDQPSHSPTSGGLSM